MIVINLFGAPSSGKSTGAAYLFSILKINGYNVELVTEFAKDKVWENSSVALENQLYISGQQSFRLSKLKDKVDIVVTDSPLILGALYNTDDNLGEGFTDILFKIFNSYKNINFFLRRNKPYNPNGRLQTEEESNEVSKMLIDLLDKHNVKYDIYNGDIDGYRKICNVVFDFLQMEIL